MDVDRRRVCPSDMVLRSWEKAEYERHDQSDQSAQVDNESYKRESIKNGAQRLAELLEITWHGYVTSD
jgi:hypothetical protein